MGIRKHFEQIKDLEDLKLSEIGLESSEPKELLFDPEKQINEQDWRDIIRELENTYQRPEKELFASYLKKAFPERTSKDSAFRKNISLGTELEIRNSMDFYEQSGDMSLYISSAENFKTLFPEAMSKVELEHLWPKICEELKKYQEKRITPDIAFSYQVLIIFPEKKDEIATEKLWQNIQKELPYYADKGDWEIFSGLTAYAKVLFPDRNIAINKGRWDQMIDHLNKLKTDKKWRDFSIMVMSLKILAAEQVKITEQGLEIGESREAIDLKQEKQKRPERKKF